MLIKFSLKNLLSRPRRSLVSLAGIIIGVALFISVVLILKSAQAAFNKPLAEAGADMIVQLQGEPCVWSIVKLPTDLNPIPSKLIDKIKALDEVVVAEGALITWAFPVSNQSQAIRTQDPSGTSHAGLLASKDGKDTNGAPCTTGPAGSFCATGEHAASGQSNFSPIVVVGVNPDPVEIGPIKKSDLKNIQGRYFTKEDSYAVILDKDFARTRNLKLEDSIDIGPRLGNKVIGIIDPGYDAKIAGAQVFVPLKVAIEMAGRGEIVDIIFVKLKGGINTAVVKQKIKKALSNDTVTITTSRDYLSSVAGFSNLAQKLMLATFLIVVLIVFLLIAKTAFGSVLERSSEVGTLKAIGWQDQEIIKLIVMENSILGFAGGLLGSVLGYLVSLVYKINLVSALPYYLNPYPPCSQYLVKTLSAPVPIFINVFLFTILFAMIIQVCFGLLATLRILKLTPIQALRKL